MTRTKISTRTRTKTASTSTVPSRLFALHINSTRFVEERTRYLEDLLNRGWSKNTVQCIAYKIAAFAGRVDVMCTGGVTLRQIQDAADDWISKATHIFTREIGPHKARTKFVRNARNWLRFMNRYREPERKPIPYSSFVLEYVAFLDQGRGLSPLSIQKRLWDIQHFLKWYELQNRPIEDVAITDVDRYFAFPRTRPLSRVTISGRATSLRSFFRYLETRKLCPAHLASAIDGPRVYKHEMLPRGPSWQEVRHLIASIGTVRAGDIRDRAMIILLAMYGFRSGEVCRLQLDNINWQKEEIVLTHSKRPNHRLYPLMREAGDAILLYLQNARPKSDAREIFLHARPPFKALTTTALGTMVRNRMKALGFTLPLWSPRFTTLMRNSFISRRSFS
jgi:integrase/recombinase XerD